MSTGIATAQKEQRQFRTLKDELKDLSTKIDRAKTMLESFQFDQTQHEALKQLLIDLEASKAALEPQVRTLGTRHTSLTNAIAAIEARIKPMQEKLDAMVAQHKDTKEAHDALKEQIRQLKIEKADLVSSKRKELKDQLGGINRDKDAANAVLKDLNTAIGVAKRKAEGLKAKAKKHDDLVAAIEAAQGRLDTINKSIVNRTADQKRAQKALDDLDAELAAKRAKFDDYVKQRETAFNLRDKDFEVREGDLNRREQWHNKRSGLLRQAKAELEEIHGRPLRHIVIPPDLNPETI